MSDFLVLHELCRSYGRTVALDGLSMKIPDKGTAAFIGANGAGKTTTFSLIGGFIQPHGGSVEIAGMPLDIYRTRGGIVGLLPQEARLYENRTVYRQILFFAQLSGLHGREAHTECTRVLELVGIQERRNDRLQELSHGMKVRVGIAQAFVGNPPLVLLDEPTAGLDPRVAYEFRNVIKSLRGTTTMVISSHNLNELEDLCDYVCIIHKGRTVREGPMKDMLATVARVSYTVDKAESNLAPLQMILPSVRFNLKDHQTIVAEFSPVDHTAVEINAKVLGWLLQNNVPVLAVEAQKSLEQTYLEETKD